MPFGRLFYTSDKLQNNLGHFSNPIPFYSSYVKDLVKQNIKFIVFGYHMVMLNALSEKLKKLKVGFIRIDGTTRTDLRTEYIDRFQNEKSCQVAVLSLKGMLLM